MCFDSSGTMSPKPASTSPSQISFATITNGCPYPLTVHATIRNASDWASTTRRPDVAFAHVTLEPFGETRARLDMSTHTSSAKYHLEVTMQLNPPITLGFDCNQKCIATIQNDLPLATNPTVNSHVVFLATQPDLLELALVVAESGN